MWGMFKPGIFANKVVTVPSAPSGASLVGNISNSTVSWTDNSSGSEQETRFRVEYNKNGGGWFFLYNTAVDATFYSFDPSSSPINAVAFDSLQCRVRAENTAGNSAYATTNTKIF